MFVLYTDGSSRVTIYIQRGLRTESHDLKLARNFYLCKLLLTYYLSLFSVMKG